MAGTATFNELDAQGNILATQSVPVGNPVSFSADGDGFMSMIVKPGPLNPSTGVSAPFQPGTVALAFPSGGFVIAWGNDPQGRRDGIPIQGSTVMAIQGRKLAIW